MVVIHLYSSNSDHENILHLTKTATFSVGKCGELLLKILSYEVDKTGLLHLTHNILSLVYLGVGVIETAVELLGALV